MPAMAACRSYMNWKSFVQRALSSNASKLYTQFTGMLPVVSVNTCFNQIRPELSPFERESMLIDVCSM